MGRFNVLQGITSSNPDNFMKHMPFTDPCSNPAAWGLLAMEGRRPALSRVCSSVSWLTFTHSAQSAFSSPASWGARLSSLQASQLALTSSQVSHHQLPTKAELVHQLAAALPAAANPRAISSIRFGLAPPFLEDPPNLLHTGTTKQDLPAQALTESYLWPIHIQVLERLWLRAFLLTTIPKAEKVLTTTATIGLGRSRHQCTILSQSEFTP